MDKVKKRITAQKILADTSKNDDKKLFEIFELYKDDLRQSNDQLYYALLGWKMLTSWTLSPAHCPTTSKTHRFHHGTNHNSKESSS